MVSRIWEKIIGEWLLIASLAGWGLTTWWRGHWPAYSRSDLRIVFILMIFLMIVKGLEESRFLEWIARRFLRGRGLPIKLVLLTAILSMFITNDVAILTVVPLTLALEIPRRHILVILETLAANAASALTPFGNPQNIFIFTHYQAQLFDFIRTILPFFLVSLLWAVLLAFREGRRSPDEASGEGAPPVEVERRGIPYLFFFMLFVGVVLRFAPLWLGGLVCLYVVFRDRRSLRIDWMLLATFLAFFGFTDNLAHLMHFNLSSPTRTFLYALLGSQTISNVPSTLLFADFTRHWHELLWGVSVGGFGNLIGSLASLIAYRLYQAKATSPHSFLLRFHLLGYATFLVGVVAYFTFG